MPRTIGKVGRELEGVVGCGGDGWSLGKEADGGYSQEPVHSMSLQEATMLTPCTTLRLWLSRHALRT